MVRDKGQKGIILLGLSYIGKTIGMIDSGHQEEVALGKSMFGTQAITRGVPWYSLSFDIKGTSCHSRSLRRAWQPRSQVCQGCESRSPYQVKAPRPSEALAKDGRNIE